jgi:hypothetical protein
MNPLFKPKPFRHGALAALVLLGLGASSCKPEEVPENAPPLEVTAVQLSKAYEDSESSAQRRYGNRPLRVTGRVTAITSDLPTIPSSGSRAGACSPMSISPWWKTRANRRNG